MTAFYCPRCRANGIAMANEMGLTCSVHDCDLLIYATDQPITKPIGALE